MVHDKPVQPQTVNEISWSLPARKEIRTAVWYVSMLSDNRN